MNAASVPKVRRLGSKIVLLVVFVSLVAMTWFVCPAFAEDPIVLPPGFEATQIGDNGFLSKPTAVAFAPDGRVFVLDEGYGTGPGTKDGPQVKVKEPGSSVYRRLFKFDHVNVKQDRGLVGMALENEFDTPGHNFMYLLYTYEPSGGPSNSAEARTQRLVRVEVPETIPSEPFEPAQEVLLGSVGTPVSATQACPYPKTPEGSFDPSGDWKPYDHTDCIPSDADEHAVDSVMVDPQDGTLWISIGDGSGGGSSPVPIAYRSQAIDSLSGKLLHVNRNGEGLEGNGTCPGVTDFDRNCTKVYARGLRNPFRFSFRPDGKVAVGDVGWETREEIDLLSSGGKDLGWPCYEGSVQTPLWKDRPECKAFYTSGTPTQSPVYDYPYPPGVGGAAVILGPTYEGTGQPSDYPDEYSGALFFSDYVSSKVSYAKFDAGGSLISGYPKTFGELPEAVDWQLAPNGDLVYVDIGFGAAGDAEPAIYEISAVENKRPVAKIELAGSPYGASPLEAKFKGSGSSDPDPGETATLSYAWDLDGDGKFDDSSEANPPPQEYTDGSKNVLVKLKVTDIHGKSDIASIALFPGDHQPQITTDPGNPTMYRGGEEIELKASAGDPDSENASLHWHALINHNNTHVHDLNSGEGDAFAFETDTDHDQPSTYEVEIYAEDERGLRTDLPNLVLKPETSTLQITSTPIGAVVTHGGSDHTTPYTGKSTIGVEVGISTVESFVSGGVEYQFDSWSNGKPRSQVVTMPEGGLSLTATYIADFTLKLKKEGTGTGTVTSSPAGISCGGTCSFEFAEGKEVTLTATPEGGSTFAGWSGSGCSGTSTCKVTMSAAKEVTATFNPPVKPEFKLTVIKAGTGAGTVTSSPAGISCGGTCSFEFAEGKEVTLTATPEGGSTFAGWSGSGCSGTSTCKVTMSAAKEVTATFNLTSKPEGDGGLDKSSDIFPAALAFNTKKGLTKGHKQSLRGSAEDASGLRKVQVALRESQKVKGRCRWWSQAKGDFPRGTASCAHPGYMKAILNGSGDQVSWTLPLKGHLPKGSYVLVFRTEDAAGNVGQSQTRLPVK